MELLERKWFDVDEGVHAEKSSECGVGHAALAQATTFVRELGVELKSPIDLIYAVTPERHPCRCHSFKFIPEPIAVTVVKAQQNGVAERPVRVQITLELGNSDGVQTFVAQVLQFARKLDRRDR